MPATFYIHSPFDHGKSRPIDMKGRVCPCVSYERWACNLMAMVNKVAMHCDGRNPPEACPLNHSNDIIISLQHKSNLVVTP